MSSFSSVVRKGPKVVAPRIAPRRNIVRKGPAPPQVVPGTATEARLPTPPATGEDTGTQVSLSTHGSTPPNRHAALEAAIPEPTLSTESSNPSGERHEVTFSTPNHAHSPVVTSSQVVSSNNGPQVTDVYRATETLSEENSSREHERTNTQQSIAAHNQSSDQSAEERNLTNNHSGAVYAAQSVSEHIPINRQDSTFPIQSRSSRKRKQPPRASANIILSQPSVSTPIVSSVSSEVATTRSQVVRRAASRTSSVSSRQSSARPSAPENEFDRISSRLQLVQDASAAINARTRSANRSTRSAEPTAPDAISPRVDEQAEQASTARPTKRRRIDRTQRRTAEEQAADVVANVMGIRNSVEPAQKRPRGATPEDAEMHEITPETTKMGELCRDRKWGKKSETEKEMAANWDEILRRRKEDAEERIALAAAGSRRRREKGQNTESNSEPTIAVVPAIGIENGVIAITSRQIDRHAQVMATAEQTNEADIREDKDIFKRVLATTVGCRNPQTQGQTWDDLATELFYTGLKKFGTDFQMISATIPGKTRKQVKLKYNIEERKNWPRVKKCLSMKEEVDLEEYAQATGVQFASVADVYKQMEEDEKRLREEDEQRRRDEGIISQDQPGDTDADVDASGEADVAIPSIETEAEAAAREIVEAAIGVDRQSTVSRVGSTTTARQTAQPSGKRKQTGKKNTAASKKGRQAAGKNKGFEGVEERIGGIEELGMSGT